MRSRVAVALTVMVGACAPHSIERPLGPLAQAFRDASQQSGVQEELLVAIGYVETRWRTPPRRPAISNQTRGQVGLMGLVDRPDQPWLEEGARRAGVTPEQAREEPRANILAAAGLFARLLEEEGVSSQRWVSAGLVRALARYGTDGDELVGPTFADEVLGLIERGVYGEGEGGELLVLPGRGKLGGSSAKQQALTDHPGARWVPALFFRSGRSAVIDTVVIHTVEGSYQSCISWFRNPSNPYQTSAHYVVRSSDGEITQMVREADTAWHARNYNSRSIGIEHEGYASRGDVWYTEAMYQASAALVRGICERHGIPMDRQHIMGHVEVPGATHTDPGSYWDWDHYISLVRGGSVQPQPPPASSCGDLTYAGECTGDTLRWCEGGAVQQVDCAVSGRRCGFQDDSVGYNCLDQAPAPAPLDPCGGETYFGRCEGQTLIWCDNGAVQRYDCAGGGQLCALQDSTTGYNCVDPPPLSGPSDPCNGETYFGRCQGDVLIWCQDSTVYSYDCGDDGQACALEDSVTGYNCL